MISLQKTFCRVCFAGLFSLIGCHHDVPLPSSEENKMHSVTFNLSGFESEITPLSGRATKRFMGGVHPDMQALHHIVPSPEPQYVYYWSFNEETLVPDVAVDEQEAGISFEANTADPDFVNGFALEPFEAGRALSIRGAKSLVIRLPIASVESLSDFSFDIKSSDTGPKDFSVSYSTDGGNTYEMLSMTNPFENTGSAQRNRYVFDVSGFSEFVDAEILQIKMDFLEGDRGVGGAYNEVTGTVHLDNIRLTGVYNAAVIEDGDPSMPETLRYYVFAADDGSLVAQEEMPIDALGESHSLTIKLGEGVYDVLFFAYRSNQGLLFPTDLANSNAFYVGQRFKDEGAITYAWLRDDFVVGDEDVAAPAVLTRCFSAVKFDFTDVWEDLTKVRKIDIIRQHENYIYTPFGEPSEMPLAEPDTISRMALVSEEDYAITFHQFLGLSDQPKNVSYELKAFGADGEVLNTLIVNERIQHNIQLVFRGKLLGDLDRFLIEINPDWDEIREHEF